MRRILVRMAVFRGEGAVVVVVVVMATMMAVGIVHTPLMV
jgi:hypothetical protein